MTDARVAAEETPAAGWLRLLLIARTLLIIGALLLGWVLLVLWWGTPSDGNVSTYEIVRAAFTVLLAGFTLAWVASIRWPRVRRSLVPVEGGLLVGLSALIAGSGGLDIVDLDVVALAILATLIGTLACAAALPLALRRRHGRAWAGGLLVTCVLVGALLPWATGMGSDGDWDELDVTAMAGWEVMRRVHPDGVVVGLTGSDWMPGNDGIDGGYGDGQAAGNVPDQVQTKLVARADGTLVLHLSALATEPGAALVQLQGARCADGRSAPVLEQWRVGDATTDVRLPVRKLDLGSLRELDSLRLLYGRGDALAPVRCVEGIDDVGASLIEADASAFAERCVAPLRLEDRERARLTAASFQDAGCANSFDRLVEVVQPRVMDPMAGSTSPAVPAPVGGPCDPTMPVC